VTVGTPVTLRLARVELDGNVLSLHDPARGYALQTLSIGYPTVREVVNNWADRSGADDQTRFYGTRTVTADIKAFYDNDAGLAVDDIAALFGPYMVVSKRPVLIWTPQSSLAIAERKLTLRPSGFTADYVTTPALRDIHLAWVSSDVGAASTVPRSAMAFAGSAILGGREYDLSYDPADAPEDMQVTPDPPPPGALFHWDNAAPINWDGGTSGGNEALWGIDTPPEPWPGVRWYPPGGQVPTTGQIVPGGDFPVQPLLEVVGPIEAPVIFGSTIPLGAEWQIVTRSALVIPAGQRLFIDTARKTVTWDTPTGTSALDMIAWTATTWPAIPPGTVSELRIQGGSAADNTQVIATWSDQWFV
jgi:hypothetical protein